MSIRKNTAFNLAGSLIPMGLSLLTIPIYIGLVGDARYGVLSVAWLLLGYFGLFDLGLGRATAQRIASLGEQSPERMASVFWTALLMNVGLGVAGGLIIWPLASYVFRHVVSVEAVLRPELAAAIPWMILAVPLATLSGVLTGALEGRARFLELNAISVVSSVVTQLLPLAVAWGHGPDLAWLLPAVVLARLLTMAALFLRCRVHVFRSYAPSISRGDARELLQFGGWVTVTALVGPLMVSLDRFVIGATLGAKAVTYYTVPFQLASRSAVLPTALVSALFPRMTAAGTSDARELAARAIRSLAVVMTPLMLLGILLVDPFMRLWLGPEFASRSSLSAQILLFGFWINAFARVPFVQLQAAGKPDVVAKIHVAELVPYLLALYGGLHFWGIPGAAAVYSLRAVGDFALLAWCAGTLRSGTRVLRAPIALMVLAIGVAAGLAAGSAVWWFAGLGLVAPTLLWSWRAAPPDVRTLVVGIVDRLSFEKP